MIIKIIQNATSPKLVSSYKCQLVQTADAEGGGGGGGGGPLILIALRLRSLFRRKTIENRAAATNIIGRKAEFCGTGIVMGIISSTLSKHWCMVHI